MTGLSSVMGPDRMRLLITGGAGYVGSVCAARLLEAGHDIVVLDDLSTGHRDAVPAGCRFVAGAVEDADAVLAEGFDGVLHFAARSLVGESMAAPQRYWLGNVVATLRLLEAMREHGTPRLVFSTTWATGPACRCGRCWTPAGRSPGTRFQRSPRRGGRATRRS